MNLGVLASLLERAVFIPVAPFFSAYFGLFSLLFLSHSHLVCQEENLKCLAFKK